MRRPSRCSAYVVACTNALDAYLGGVALAAVLLEDLSATGRSCHPGQTRGAGFVEGGAPNVEGGLGG